MFLLLSLGSACQPPIRFDLWNISVDWNYSIVFMLCSQAGYIVNALQLWQCITGRPANTWLPLTTDSAHKNVYFSLGNSKTIIPCSCSQSWFGRVSVRWLILNEIRNWLPIELLIHPKIEDIIGTYQFDSLNPLGNYFLIYPIKIIASFLNCSHP